MQVVCGNCQLTFDAPEGTTGLVCPICRNPLEVDAAGAGGPPAPKKMIEWSGGALTDLIALLSAPAASARVEVIPPGTDAFIGEVHLVAGGVSDSIYEGNATDDALDRLLLITGARFRVDPRLPDPKTGDLGKPGAESGTLDGRPLAHLMRYCEDYVITCGIEVWRGNETARVDYRRGEISGVTVGGIDAPERLAEVMQWASGNYRLIVPPIQLPAVAPKHAPAPAPLLAPEPAGRSATKTIFGLPQSEVAAARAAAEAIMAAQGVGTPAPPDVAPPPVAAPVPVEVPAPAPMPSSPITPPGLAPSAIPSPLAAAARASASKTIFGMSAPVLPESYAAPAPAAVVLEPAATAHVTEADTGRTDRLVKTGARKVAVPAPEIVVPTEAPAPAPAKEVGRTTHHGFETRPTGSQKKVEERSADKSADRSADKSADKSPGRTDKAPARAASPSSSQRPAAIWTYVGVGFTFGLVLLGIYQLVGRLAH
ncbi:MAG: hypothetical protein JWM82_1313 [Myxococcales bacterium]|nr:hypothetical protein [Myxococcales bacterium]